MYSQSSRRAAPGRGAGGPGPGHRASSGSYARQTAAPYARPSAPQSASPAPHQASTAASQSWPPSQLNIRGASSIPTQVLVANLAKGTSSEDVRQTFLQFGDIIRVKERVSAGGGQPSVAYEVLFEEKPAAVKSVEQLHGALADGRILSVTIETDTPAPSPAPAQQAEPRTQAAAPADTTQSQPASRTPTGPRSNGRAPQGNGSARGQQRELIATPAAVAKKAAAAVIPRGPAAQVLTAKDRKALVNAAAKQAAAAALAASNVPKGPRAQSKSGAMASAPSLQSRLGGLPLAQRLGDVKGAGRGGAGSDLSTLDGQKSRKIAQREKAKLAASAAARGAAAPVPGVPGQGVSAAAKKKRKAKAKKAVASGAGGMEID
ncbi:unnamed protein product [Parajaminaea phylloscopi]